MDKKNRYCIALASLSLLMASTVWAETTVNNPSAEPEKNTIFLTPASQQAAGIAVETLQLQKVNASIPAPGEVIPNAILTSKVTTRVTAQVISRTVQEGQHVKKEDVLAILSSVDMAKVQGDLLLAQQEWERVKALGKDAVSGKRYNEAQVLYQHAYSTALAYGMTETEINGLLTTRKPSQTKGEFNLLAPRDGTVFNINFTEGELIEPGRVLLQIVDEKNVWVDAKLAPDTIKSIKVGDLAYVIMGERKVTGQVIQVHHQLDETTRTQSVRLEIPNTEDLLHPGQFVNCRIEIGQTEPVLALPQSAILRTTDGDWAVYVEKKPNYFQQIEIKVVETVDGQVVISGLAAGARVVIKGTFFVHSELNKQGFDAHGH